MKKFFLFQMFIFSIGFVLNVLFNHYISPPFNKVDVIAIMVASLIFFPFISKIDRIYKPFIKIHKRRKIVLSIFAFLAAVLLVGYVENMWYSITGNMLFDLE